MEEILKRLDAIESKMATKEDLEGLATKEDLEDLATRQDVMHVSDTLQTINEEVATTLEHRQEAGDVLLKSMIDGLRNEMNSRFDQVDQRFDILEERFQSMHNTMIAGFKQLGELMGGWIEKQKMVDNELRFHYQRIVNSEKKTEELERRLKDLESK
jgi:hypothetical protein